MTKLNSLNSIGTRSSTNGGAGKRDAKTGAFVSVKKTAKSPSSFVVETPSRIKIKRHPKTGKFILTQGPVSKPARISDRMAMKAVRNYLSKIEK